MDILYSRAEVGVKFVVPYRLKKAVAGWKYNYWGLRGNTTVLCDRSVEPGQAVTLVKVNDKKQIIRVTPCECNIAGLPELTLMSNNIDLDETEEYEFSYVGCTPLLALEECYHGNKVYTLAVLVEAQSATIRAYCHGSRTRLTFYVDKGARHGRR